MKVKNQYQRHKLKENIRLLTPEEKINLAIKLYQDNTTLKLMASLFECDMSHIVQLLEERNIKKKCTKCKKLLSRDQFRYRDSSDKLSYQCIDCLDEYRKDYYNNNFEKCISDSIQWKRNNKERVSELRKIRNQNNDVKKKNSEYMKIKRDSDPMFKLRCTFSNLISYSLKSYATNDKSKHNIHWENNIVNYNLSELAHHLESQFQPGMNWNNYGQWHVDHIIPQSHFEFTSYKDPKFHECWSLKNLQPLWAIDNFKKGNRIIG